MRLRSRIVLGATLAVITAIAGGYAVVRSFGLAGTYTVFLAQLGLGLGAAMALAVYAERDMIGAIRRLTCYCGEIVHLDRPAGPVAVRSRDEIGELGGKIGSLVARFQHDIAKRKETERHLSAAGERHELALKATGEGLWDWNLRTNEVFVSSEWQAMVGREAAEATLPFDHWLDLIHPDDREGFKTSTEAWTAAEASVFEREYRIRHEDGSYLWVLARGAGDSVQGGETKRLAGLQTDISQHRERMAQLAHEALHDSLTGLANRSLLEDHLDLSLKRMRRNKKYRFAVLLLDLDRFKVVNDGLGHLVGDRMLAEVADRIRSSVRATDTLGRCGGTVARLGGDEFVILLEHIYDVMDAIHVAERVQQAIVEPYRIEGHEIFSSVSIGIKIGVDSTDSADDLLRHADTALYRAKAQGGRGYAVFDMRMASQASRRLKMETQLRRALEHREFAVYYQPIVSLDTGKAVSFEALVRWQSQELGLVTPNEFLKTAEDIGVIVPMGRYVAESACRQVRSWQAEFAHASSIGVAVNFSVTQLTHAGLKDLLREALGKSGVGPTRLTLEVTESALMADAEAMVELLEGLRAMDVQIAIDDFGTGYSSLSYLSRFSVDNLKIDLSFVKAMSSSPESLQLVKTMLALSHSMGLSVTAEGIETDEQLALLRELGCDFGQGYLFSKPVPAQEATQLLASNPTW